MDQVKILFVYTDKNEESTSYKIESLWASKEANYYKIDNIPFYVNNIALEDIINVEFDPEENALYFEELITPSGNSVVRIIPFNESDIELIGNELVALGCEWESLKNHNLISVHIPKYISYKKIKEYLESGKDRFDYQEACLGFK